MSFVRSLVRTTVAAVIAVAAVPAAAGGCVETLHAVSVHELPAAVGPRGLAWLRDGVVAIGADSGIYEYGLADRSLEPLVARRAVPDGLPHVWDVATDGRSLVAFNLDYSELAYDLAGARIVTARRFPAMQILDMAVRGDTMVVLGYPAVLEREKNGALWSGKLGAKWESFRLLHKVDDDDTAKLRSCFPPFGGAVTIQRDGTVAMITAAEPGVRRFRTDGTPLPTLGGGLVDLVPANIAAVRTSYFGDLTSRYVDVLNRQPMADDLIETPAGLAIVVRRAAEGSVSWELWFPGEGGGLRRRIQLAASDKRAVGGHLRCHARGPQLACLFGKATGPDSADKPYLMLFDLNRVVRTGKCRT